MRGSCNLLHVEADDHLPVLVIDGSRFSDLAGFAEEFSKFLTDDRWRGDLDVFNDLLCGGFGTPEGEFTLRWDHSALSRVRLGHAEMAKRFERLLRTCHPTNRRGIAEELAAARRGVGPTLFDLIVEIIEQHGPGGIEAADGVRLELR